jgi:protein-S-isoprenylcysteine O-methyltransferase
MMMNPICFIGFAGALYHFFSERIEYEEQLLTRFFGQNYRDYKAKTMTGLPLIK